jgi:lipid-A-disaccharide synthase
MPEALRLFVLAGEPSGDRLGADLVARLRHLTPLELTGVGGADLEAAGLVSLFPMRELAVMGWADVIPRLPLLLWRVRQVARAILRQRPDVVVLIDAQVFSTLVAQRLRRAGYDRPVLLYVAPAVWGWKFERARKIAPLFDEVLAVLPFEPRVMAGLGGPPTTYVGHPAARTTAPRASQPDRGPLLLLPGSREGELRRHLPLMRGIAQRFATHPRVSGFVVPTIGAVESRVRHDLANWPVPVKVAVGEEAWREATASAVAAVAVTGTVTLELALAAVPMVAVYIPDAAQARLFRRYNGRFAALPNLLLDRPLVPEILRETLDIDAVATELASVLDADAGRTQLESFERIRTMMREGLPGAPVEDPAARVLHHAARQRLPAGT